MGTSQEQPLIGVSLFVSYQRTSHSNRNWTLIGLCLRKEGQPVLKVLELKPSLLAGTFQVQNIWGKQNSREEEEKGILGAMFFIFVGEINELF